MRAKITGLSFAAVLWAATPLGMAQAHRQFLLPSTTQLDEPGSYVTVDAAVAETLFDFDSFPLKLDGLTITGPDGQAVQPEGMMAGKRRNVFDAKLVNPGTYRFSVVIASVMASYKIGEETKRFRGSESELATAVPKDAADLNISRSEARVETFVAAGQPTAVAPIGKGLEILPLTDLADNVVGATARFSVLVDGKPIPGLDVTVVPGGGRFRGNLGDMSIKSDAQGQIAIKWTQAGNIWVGASWPPRPVMQAGGPGNEDSKSGNAAAIANGAGSGGPGAGPRGPQPPRRLNYSATYEVAPF